MWIGPGGVGGDELEVDLLACEVGGVAVGRAGVDDVVDHHALGGGLDAQVDEAGSRDVGAGDAVGARERRRPASRPTRGG